MQMGNFLEKNILGVSNTQAKHLRRKVAAQNNNNDSMENKCKPINDHIQYQIYSYKQNMIHKERHLVKWIAAKLTLTEEILRAYKENTKLYTQESLYINLAVDKIDLKNDSQVFKLVEKEQAELECYRAKLHDLLKKINKAKRKQCKQSIKRKRLNLKEKHKNKSNKSALKLVELNPVIIS